MKAGEGRYNVLVGAQFYWAITTPGHPPPIAQKICAPTKPIGQRRFPVGAQFYWAMAERKRQSTVYRAEIRPTEVQSCAPTKYGAFGSYVC